MSLQLIYQGLNLDFENTYSSGFDSFKIYHLFRNLFHELLAMEKYQSMQDDVKQIFMLFEWTPCITS